jgi:hypothetical protein
MYIRSALPRHHLRDDAKDVVRLSTGLIGTMAALVLGLLIASAKSSYDARTTQIKQITANIILLDQLLEQYGSDGQNLRISLRRAVPPLVDRIWNEGNRTKNAPFAATVEAQNFVNKIQELQPNNDSKRAFQAVCSGAAIDLHKYDCSIHPGTIRSVPFAILILARNYFHELWPVCTERSSRDRDVFRRRSICSLFTFSDLGNGSAFCGAIADFQ